METWLPTPQAVKEAKESQKGMHWALEILVFAAVFLVCTIAQILSITPIQIALLSRDDVYMDAVSSGDIQRIAVALEQVLEADIFTILSLFTTIWMIAFVLLFCKLVQKRKMRTLGFVKEGAAKAYITGILIGFLMFSVAVGICVLTGSMTLVGVLDTFRLSTFLLFVAGFMIQGMAEEVLCRGYFMVSLGRRYPMAAAIGLNAAAFAALHLLNPGIAPLAVINLILFGIFASLCFVKTGNIWLIGALHSVWNLVQGNVYGIQVSGMKTSCTVFRFAASEGKELIHGGSFGLEGGLAVTIALIAGIAICCLYKKRTSY